MPRLSQAESRELTRHRLIDAAARVFAQKGYAGASLEEISDAAGYTRGALYYNFAGKDELFLAVVQRRSDAEISAITDVLKLSDDPGQFIAALRTRAADRRSSKDRLRWAQLSDEFWLYSLRHPHARRLLAQHNRQLRAAYAQGIKTVLARIGVEPPAPLEHLGAVMFALDHSLPRQHWLDPQALPEDLFFDMINLLIRAAVALDQNPT